MFKHVTVRVPEPLRTGFVDSCVFRLRGRGTGVHIRIEPVYTRGGTYTHPLCIVTHYPTTARVNAPTRVYAARVRITHPGAYSAPAAYTLPTLRKRRDATNGHALHTPHLHTSL